MITSTLYREILNCFNGMNELSCYLQEVFSRKTEQEFPQWGRKYKDDAQAYQRLPGLFQAVGD